MSTVTMSTVTMSTETMSTQSTGSTGKTEVRLYVIDDV